MSNGMITLTDRDWERLGEMAASMQSDRMSATRNHLDKFKQEIERAKIIASEKVSANIVTMNSKVRFRDLDTGEVLTYTVTWPHLADPEQKKVSVLAPIGMALIGTRVGQTVEWEAPVGKRRFKVEKILFQPESKGMFE